MDSYELLKEMKKKLNELDNLKIKIASMESLIEELANEFMEVVDNGKFKYTNSRLSDRVNEIYL